MIRLRKPYLLLVPLMAMITVVDTFTAGHTAAAPYVTAAASRQTEVIMGRPVEITVPSLGINVPIVEGMYDPDSSTWTLNHATAQHAIDTPLANDATGNTFIYGHNNRLVFKNLVNIQPGTIVSLKTDNNHTFYYRFTDSIDVMPNQVSSIENGGKARLTIQTCVGAHYELRRMFHLTLVSVDKQPHGAIDG